MKRIFNAGLVLVAAGALLFSCKPMDKDDYQLGTAVSESQLDFTYSPSSAIPSRTAR